MKNNHHILLHFILLFTAHIPVYAADCNIIEPKALLKIMEDSVFKYHISPFKKGDISDEFAPKLILVNDSYLEINQNETVLKKYTVDPTVNNLLGEGEKYFIENNYKKAIATWSTALEKDPNYFLLYTMIGDAYFSQKDYEKAKKYFIKSIKLNPIDYQAQWFLAKTYKKLANRKAALEHIILAHLYNYHHLEIFSTLQKYLHEIGQEWQNWNFIPQYKLRKINKDIDIKVEIKWLGYALSKAVWRFESNYHKFGKKEDALLNPCEEKQSIVMLIPQLKEELIINDVIKKGMIGSFIYYETALRKYPGVARLLPTNSINDIVNYLKSFHIKKAQR